MNPAVSCRGLGFMRDDCPGEGLEYYKNSKNSHLKMSNAEKTLGESEVFSV